MAETTRKLAESICRQSFFVIINTASTCSLAENLSANFVDSLYDNVKASEGNHSWDIFNSLRTDAGILFELMRNFNG